MSTKVESSPLFTPGFHEVTLERLEEICVKSFDEPSRTHRQELLDKFKTFLTMLKGTGVHCELWVDGSFTTQKPDPADIDLLVITNPQQLAIMKADKQAELRQLLSRGASKLRYKCDVLSTPKNDANKISYWRGWFGFDRNEAPKGIARIRF